MFLAGPKRRARCGHARKRSRKSMASDESTHTVVHALRDGSWKPEVHLLEVNALNISSRHAGEKKHDSSTALSITVVVEYIADM